MIARDFAPSRGHSPSAEMMHRPSKWRWGRWVEMGGDGVTLICHVIRCMYFVVPYLNIQLVACCLLLASIGTSESVLALLASKPQQLGRSQPPAGIGLVVPSNSNDQTELTGRFDRLNQPLITTDPA